MGNQGSIGGKIEGQHDVYPVNMINKDHPNPFTYPTPLDQQWMVGYGMGGYYSQLYKGHKRGDYQKSPNFLDDDPFYVNIFRAFKQGMILGTVHAAGDILMVNQIEGFRAQFARYIYVCAPWPMMTTGFIASYHLLSQKLGRDKYYTNYLAATVPAAVWGLYKGTFYNAPLITFVLGTAGVIFKADKNIGGMTSWIDKDRSITYVYDWDTRSIKATNRFPNSWKKGDQWPLYPRREMTEAGLLEPSWHKHVSEEERTRGPPTGL